MTAVSAPSRPGGRGRTIRLAGAWLLLALTTVLVAVIGFFGIALIEQNLKDQIANQLRLALSSSEISLQRFVQHEEETIQNWAATPPIQANIIALARQSLEGEADAEKLRNLPEQSDLHALLDPVCRAQGYTGFVVFNETGLQIAASRDEMVGSHGLQGVSGFFDRAFSGDTHLSIPFADQLGAVLDDKDTPTNQAAMFFATPVRDSVGRVQAVLAFRARPTRELSRVLDIGRTSPGSSTYAFDRNGVLLSEARFSEQLRGLLGSKSVDGKKETLALRDPGVNLAAGFQPTLPREQWPLTRMAASAVSAAGGTDRDIEGYRDFRGVTVVGAWRWLPQYGFGLAHEIEYDEAYRPLQTVRGVFYASFALLLVTTAASVLLHVNGLRADRRRLTAEDALRESEARFRALCESAPLGIFECDASGRTTYVNRFWSELTGTAEPATLGERWTQSLHPEDREEVAASWNQAIASGTPWSHEYRCLTRSGEVRWVRSKTASLGNNGHSGFVGCVEDVTQEKLAEAAIMNYQERLRTVSFESALTEERERRRIAADLHDRIGQALALTQIKLGSLRDSVSSPEGARALSDCIRLLEETVVDTRTLTFDLSPPVLYDLGFKAAVQWLADWMEDQHGLRVEVIDDDEPKPLENEVAAMLLRAVRELLMNVLKHSQSPVAGIMIERRGETIHVEVSDAGLGMKSPAPTSGRGGFGLFSVREQMSRLGGSMTIQSTPMKGTTVTLIVPLNTPSLSSKGSSTK